MNRRDAAVVRNPGAPRALTRRRFVSAAVATLGAVWWVPIVSRAQTLPGSPSDPAGTPTPEPGPTVVPAAEATDGEQMFLEFPDPTEGGGIEPLTITGESTDAEHPGAIELLGALLGMQSPITIESASSSMGAGPATFQALRIVKPVDSASPGLLSVCGSGATLPTANLYVRAANSDTDNTIYQFKLLAATNLHTHADESLDTPQETIELQFGAVQISYTASGAATPDRAAWSVVLNEPTFEVTPVAYHPPPESRNAHGF